MIERKPVGEHRVEVYGAGRKPDADTLDLALGGLTGATVLDSAGYWRGPDGLVGEPGWVVVAFGESWRCANLAAFLTGWATSGGEQCVLVVLDGKAELWT